MEGSFSLFSPQRGDLWCHGLYGDQVFQQPSAWAASVWYCSTIHHLFIPQPGDDGSFWEVGWYHRNFKSPVRENVPQFQASLVSSRIYDLNRFPNPISTVSTAASPHSTPFDTVATSVLQDYSSCRFHVLCFFCEEYSTYPEFPAGMVEQDHWKWGSCSILSVKSS